MSTSPEVAGTRRLRDTEAAATYLEVSSSLLEKMRSQGRGPRYRKIGGLVRYSQSDLDQYLESTAVETTESRKGRAA